MNTPSDSPVDSAPTLPRALRARLWAWAAGVFLPPLLATAWYVWLKLETDDGLPAAYALQSASVVGSDTVQAVVWFFAWRVLAGLGVLAAIVLLFWLRRRPGFKWLGLLLLALWWLLCAGWAWSAWSAYADRAQLTPMPAVQARVLGVGEREASEYGPGGAQVYLQASVWPGPRSVLLEDARAGSVEPGSTLALRMARGARGGDYVTAWSVAASAPASAASAAASAAPPAGR